MVDTIKFSQMTDGGDIANDDKVPGLLSGANVLFNNPWTFLPPGTTAERPTPSSTINYRLRFNTDEQLYEYYDATLGAWTQLQESAFTVGPFITYTADTSLPDAQNLGLLANGILKQTISAGSATLNIAVNDTDYYGPGMTGYFQAPAGVKDSNGNIVLGFVSTASSVNYLNITNYSTGGYPRLSAAGSDANIQLGLVAKGNRYPLLIGGTTSSIGCGWAIDGTAQAVLNNIGGLTGTRTVTWQDSDGVVAFLGDIPAPPSGAVLSTISDTNITLTAGGNAPIALLNSASITAGWTGQLSLARGGTNASLIASNGGIVYSTASAMAILAGTVTANLPLLSGSTTAPSWGSFPLLLGGALTTAGALTTIGAFSSTFTFTNTTSVTFPTSGTLATTSQLLTSPLTTKGDLWAWSTTDARLPVGSSNGQILQVSSAAATGLAYSTATYPATTTINQILYSSAANTITGLATANTSVLTTGGTGVPGFTAFVSTGGTNGGTNNIVSRSASGYSSFGNVITGNTARAAGSSYTLSAGSNRKQVVTGSGATTIILPDATTLVNGFTFEFANNSSGVVTVEYNDLSTAFTMAAGDYNIMLLNNNVTTNGSWSFNWLLPSTAPNGTIYQGNGSNAGYTLSTATYPSTTTINQLLYSSAANTITGLATANNAILVTNGSGVPSLSTTLPSGIAIKSVNLQQFAAGTTTYTPSSNMVSIIVEIIGGGGGAGGSLGGSAGNFSTSGGGTGGGYCRKIYTSAQLGANAAVIVGAFGQGGNAGNNAGNDGGDSTFTPAGAGAALFAPGGTHGSGAASSTTLTTSGSAIANTPTGGDLNIAGQDGGAGAITSITTGIFLLASGGGSALGQGAPMIVKAFGSSYQGHDGVGYGAGGGGAGSSTVSKSGGSGTDGICLVWEFIA